MTTELAIVLAACVLGASACGYRGLIAWQRVHVADAKAREAEAICRQTESNNQRRAAERLHDQVRRFEQICGAGKADNLRPISETPPVRPHFGRRLHVVETDPPHPEGAA